MPGFPWAPDDDALIRDVALRHAGLPLGFIYTLLPATLRAGRTPNGLRLRLKRMGLGSRAKRLAVARREGIPQAPVPVSAPPADRANAARPDAPEDDATLVQRATAREQAQRRVQEAEHRARALQAALADRADLIAAFHEAVAAYPRERVTAPLPAPDVRLGGDRTLVLFLSDIHIGQLFERVRGGGLGEYDLARFRLYVDRLVAKVLAVARDLRAAGPVRRLIVIWGGDLVDGRDIHAGHTLEATFIAVQIRVGVLTLSDLLVARFSAAFESVEMFGFPGNHGRQGKKGQLDYVRDSNDTIFLDWLEDRCCALSNVRWHPRDTWFSSFTLYGHWFLAAHGDSFKSFARIPFYGSMRYLSDLSALFHRPIDVLLCGHHHSSASFPKGFANIAMNGCWPGTSTFGSHQLGVGGPPVQKLLLVTPELPAATQYDLFLATRAEMLTHEPVNLDVAVPPTPPTDSDRLPDGALLRDEPWAGDS